MQRLLFVIDVMEIDNMAAKGNVMMIEYSESYGDLTVDMVALFDGRDFTEGEVLEMIRSGEYENTNKIAVMSKKQYEIVFRSMRGSDEKKFPAKDVPACPFCGEDKIELVQYQHAAGLRWKIRCTDCLAEIDPGWAQDPSVVLNMWRGRSSPTQLHATWIDCSTKANCGKKCSRCGARITNREYVAGTHPFCHKCGAIMHNASDVQKKIRDSI